MRFPETHEGGASQNRMSVLTRVMRELASSPCSLLCEATGSQPSAKWKGTRPRWTSDLRLPASRAMRSKLVLFISLLVFDILLPQPKWTNAMADTRSRRGSALCVSKEGIPSEDMAGALSPRQEKVWPSKE